MALSLCRNLINFESNIYNKTNSCLKWLYYSTSAANVSLETPETSSRQIPKSSSANNKYRYIYQEFLPDPEVKYRNYLREKLERRDMIDRRKVIDIPEFYVGSIMAVKSSDPHAQSKMNRFVGICIEKMGAGLRTQFTLRNVVDHQGIEVRYYLYDPLIHNIQVLRLEKRLDPHLRYLKDAPPEYSTFDFNMEPEILPEGAEVPINRVQIPLNPKPWQQKWERQNLKGIKDIEKLLRFKDKQWLKNFSTPWEKYDLMKEYRKTIPEEEQNEIWSEVYNQIQQLEITRQKITQRRTFVLPKKTG